jgi:copper chaperone CopZ
MSTPDIREYQVQGMTCQHCVDAVRTEVTQVPGIEVASVNLDLGLLTVAGQDYSDDAVKGAIREAGYEVA